MTTEDDRIRQALSRGEPSFTAHSALQQLRPTMQRARLRRRVAAGATTLALLAAVSAGALTLATSLNPPTLRTVNNDETGQSVLPEPTPVPTTTAPPTTVPPTTQAPDVTPAPPAMVIAPEPTTSSVEPEADDAAPPAADGRAPGAKPPVPTIAPPAPAPTPPPMAAPPAIVAPAVSQTIASDCGDVIVSIENGTVRIVSIAARPGYEAAVSDDGPTVDRDRPAQCGEQVRTPCRTQVGRAGRRSAEPVSRPLSDRRRLSVQLSTLPTSTSTRDDRAGLSFALRAARISTMVRNITMLMEARAAMRNTSFCLSVPAAIA